LATAALPRTRGT